MDSDRGRIDKYTILGTLGKGSTAKVKLASNIETGEKIALKIINQDKLFAMKIELNALQNIPEHPNIVKLIGHSNSSIYHKREGQSKLVSYIALELGKKGEIFDYIFKLGGFPEPIARRYAKQLLSAVESLHNSGIVHRDLKPENIFFSENFELKLADFGFTAPAKGRNGLGLLGTYKGTRPYMAPEILERKRYRGTLTDIFSCGIILFIFVLGRPPFLRAERQNPHYQYIVNNNWNRFWNIHISTPNTPSFSHEFRDLIEHMLAYNPDERFTMEQIKNHPWMTKEISSQVEAQQFLSAASIPEISESPAENSVEGYRGPFYDNCEMYIPSMKKFLNPMEITLTRFHTDINADDLQDAVKSFFEEKLGSVKILPNSYLIRICLNYNEQPVKIDCSFATKNGKTLVEFVRLEGDPWDYYCLYQEFFSILEENNSECTN